MSWFLLCPALASAESITASWYGPGFEHHKMACGKRFHARDITIVASKTLPCGTTVWLTNPATGKVVPATVQDRGPYIKGRELDASQGLARVLGYEQQGVARLEVSYTNPSEPPAPETVPADGWTNADDINSPIS